MSIITLAGVNFEQYKNSVMKGIFFLHINKYGWWLHHQQHYRDQQNLDRSWSDELQLTVTNWHVLRLEWLTQTDLIHDVQQLV